MEIKKFIIHSYKAIEKDLVVDLSQNNVLALIGLNECGKTTILKAITAFDARCDKFKDDYGQFNDLDKKYIAAGNRTNTQFSISAVLTIEEKDKDDLKQYIINNRLFTKDINGQDIFTKKSITKTIDENNNEIQHENIEFDEELYQQTINEMMNIELHVKRQMENHVQTYYICWDKIQKSKIEDQNTFINYALKFCPEILFFFDKMDYTDTISINDTSITKSIVENLFKSAANLTLEDFFNLDDDSRGSVVSDINNELNENFTKKWNDLSINSRFGTLRLELKDDFATKRIVIKVNEIIKSNENGQEKDYTRQFSLKDRSAGFNWYFKFVLTLLYYPTSEDQKNEKKIYLFDEPGLYLHEHAQINLSKTFQTLSKNNIVIYTTHCHGMLNIDLSNPDGAFSLKNIFIVSKEPNDFIKIYPSYDYVDLSCNDSRTASFKPIMYALQLQFCNFIKNNAPVLIVEGINDYYIIHGLLRDKLNNIQVFPSMGADNIYKHIPYFMMYGNPFVILFDNDKKGYDCYLKIKEDFGTRIANKILFLNRGNYYNTQQSIDKFEMEDYFVNKKDEYRQIVKFKARNWFSDFAEKIFKKDYRIEIDHCDSSVINDFDQLLNSILLKIQE